MEVTAFVDVAIGLSVVYLGTSLIVTIVNEYLAQVARLRGRQLARNLEELISDEQLQAVLRRFPAFAPFFGGRGRKSAYIDPKLMAQALLGVLGSARGGAAELRSAISKLHDEGLSLQLLAIFDEVDGNFTKFVEEVAEWIDRSLTIMGEAFKRQMRWISFGVGLMVSVTANIDTFALADHLYRDKETRALASSLAERVAHEVDAEDLGRCRGSALEKPECAAVARLMEVLRGEDELLGELPIGWKESDPPDPIPGEPRWWSRCGGWLVTALSISVGAAFWFDALKKLVNLRDGPRKPELRASR